MVLTQEQRKELQEIIKPVIKWLNDNCHQHVKITIDPTHAELKESITSTGQIVDFMKNNISVTFFAKTILTEFAKVHKENKRLFDSENETLIASQAISEYIKREDSCLYYKLQSSAKTPRQV